MRVNCTEEGVVSFVDVMQELSESAYVLTCFCFSVSDSAVMSFLSVGGKECWKGRGSVGVVVLVDDHSAADSPGETLLALKDSLALVSHTLS